MGLTRMKAATFYWVSQLGMLAGTIVYVNAGTQLAKIESLRGILSPGLIGSFVLLGVFPLIAKKIVEAIKRRKVYARWAHAKPKRFDRNLIVIGAGAAGLVTSYIAAAVKAKVTLVESHKMGGDCLNFGCVPSKALIRTAKLVKQIRCSTDYGIEKAERAVPASPDDGPHPPRDRADRAARLGRALHRARRRRREGLREAGRTRGPCRSRATTAARKRSRRSSIVLATGARAGRAAAAGARRRSGFLTSDTLWDAARAAAAAGRARRRADRLRAGAGLCAPGLAGDGCGDAAAPDDQGGRGGLGARAGRARKGRRAGAAPATRRCAARRTASARSSCSSRPAASCDVEFDVLICAVGRAARLEGYGLEELGIPTERTIETNEYLETLYPEHLRRRRRRRAVSSSRTWRRTRRGTRRSTRCSAASRSSRPTTR